GFLNIAYFWPVVYQAFFESEDAHDAKPLVENPLGGTSRSSLVETDGGHPEDGDAEDEDTDDLDVDPEELGRPDFSGSSEKRDYSEPAPLVDGEYAVDQNPSDHTVDEGDEGGDGDEGHTADDHHAPGDHHDDHHGGPPPSGWTRSGWFGGESTWFMLGPILAAMMGSVVLGLVPHAAVFLRLIDGIVSAVLAGVAL
ncbi:MAG: cation:proton antiporter, partial [Natronomonas sp.]